ncbi:hypothetical protein P6B95_37320 [Streptomyces atratus]|uniref:hypothetical protein n=1 Tax=Streptomyces atratus TaxID=1893 RepID=UPI002AC32925|nr:hypothetical protein [Streptomyces atratus]WPW32477.1 hypothetical protein P6B95_37320 [Streptomyces atratus]
MGGGPGGDLGRAATEDTGMDGDAAVGRHREPGLGLLEVHPPVLGMPVADEAPALIEEHGWGGGLW